MIYHPSEKPAPPIPAASSFREQTPVEDVGPDRPIKKWWTSFEDPLLNELMEEAFDTNLELLQLVARLEQAQALTRQARGQLFPTVDGVADYDSRWIDDLNGNTSPESHQESLSLGGRLQWEIDLWGKLRSAQRSREFQTDVARHEWQGGRLLLAAALAENYFQILEQRQQLALVREQIDINLKLLDLTKLRFGQGQSSIVDVLQQREQLAATRSLVPQLEARLGQLEYSLDVLMGKAPGDGTRIAPNGLRPFPPPPPLGIPSDLLQNRPDVQAARSLVTALDYRVGEAMADRLPRFVLGGSLLAAGDPGLTEMVTTALASALGPIIDGGTRRAEVAFRRAEVEEALAAFAQTYLVAVQEVESALLQERKQEELLIILEDELRNAEQLLTETRNRYSQGVTDYLPVLAAVIRKQELERDLITSRRELYSFRVALHRSLGGPMEPLTTPMARRSAP